MSFQQVFYTSCEEGLSGSKGFQVKAASPEIPPAVLQTVERLGLYIPPLSAPSRPTLEEIEQFPVSLIFQTLSDTSAVLGQARYVGLDYSGRYGNFFTHSLVSPAPYTDFRQNNRILPIEMWKSGMWMAIGNDSTMLPCVERISGDGKIDFPNVQMFLQTAAHREMLPRFLTAIIEALNTNRRIIIVDNDETIAFWIAAASYALPYHLVLKLTFNTYVNDPYKTEALIAGTTEDSSFNFAPHEIEYQFFVFDPKGDRFTRIEPNGFASKAAFIYAQPNAAMITRFAAFVEEVAPELTVEELNDALATYGYFENLDLPGVDDVRVLSWCSRYLPKLANKDFDNLFEKVTKKTPVDEETLRAATDFYLATLSSRIQTGGIRRIENLYFGWLIAKASPTAETDALRENVQKLPHRVQLRDDESNPLGDWIKTLRDCGDPTRFELLLQIGDILGFLESENEMLHWIGKNVTGKWLKYVSIQGSVRRMAKQPGGRKLLEGIAEFLVGQIDNIALFNALSTLVTDENAFRILSDYAAGNENLPLYLRLGGIKANITSEYPDRITALNYLLSDVKHIFRAEITAEIVQSAFNAIWLDRAPTLEEAVQLISTELRDYIVKTDIPPQLVDLINPETESFSPEETALIKILASNDVYHHLGDKAGIAQVYRLIAEMQGDFVDQDGTKIIESMNWAAENRLHIIKPAAHRLHRLLGQKFIRVKNVPVHSKNLPGCLKEPSGEFFKGYSAEAEKILQIRENCPLIARLLKIWSLALQDDRTFEKYLINWSGIILKSQSRKDIEIIENSLDKYTYKIWTTIKTHLKEQDKGMLGRFFGGLFGNKS